MRVYTVYYDFSGFPEYFHNIIYDTWVKRPKFFAILHCLMWFLICLTLSLVKSDEPWSKTEMLLLYPNMIPWHFTNSPAYCELFQNSLHGCYITFSLLLASVPTFLEMCCSRQNLNLFILQNTFMFGQWKLWYMCQVKENKSQILDFIAFFKTPQLFMNLGCTKPEVKSNFFFVLPNRKKRFQTGNGGSIWQIWLILLWPWKSRWWHQTTSPFNTSCSASVSGLTSSCVWRHHDTPHASLCVFSP